MENQQPTLLPLAPMLEMKPYYNVTRSEDDPKRHLGGARGRKTRKSLLKRVKSDANFIQGRVVVSTIGCIQEVKSTTEADDQIDTDEEEGGENEENSVEVEVTLKNWSNVEQASIMEGKEMLLVCIPPWSLIKANVHTLARESVDQPLMTLEMHPKSLESKANNMKAGQMHPQVLETTEHPPGKPSEPTAAVQTIPQQSQTHAKISTSNKIGLHPERARASSKAQSKTACRAQKPLKTSEDLHKDFQTDMIPSKAKESAQGQLKTLNFIPMAREALLQRVQGGGKRQANAGFLEVKEVECECCGMGEECTIGYAEHVKGIFSGHWVCGLCAEAIYEERHRLGKGSPMEEAVCTHMNLCKQFSSMKKAGGPPHSPGVAHAVCHLLSRHLGDPASPRTTPVRPFFRTISCLPSL
ncbi:hypothetical protein L7F22_048572 [Adiantum nelumboides]|nr:hypothetical protein [Adiantum nelumboides]